MCKQAKEESHERAVKRHCAAILAASPSSSATSPSSSSGGGSSSTTNSPAAPAAPGTGNLSSVGVSDNEAGKVGQLMLGSWGDE